jgi:hypothetical protein
MGLTPARNNRISTVFIGMLSISAISASVNPSILNKFIGKKEKNQVKITTFLLTNEVIITTIIFMVIYSYL